MTIQMVKIQPNAFVSLDYTLHDEDGDLLDSSDADGATTAKPDTPSTTSTATACSSRGWRRR